MSSVVEFCLVAMQTFLVPSLVALHGILASKGVLGHVFLDFLEDYVKFYNIGEIYINHCNATGTTLWQENVERSVLRSSVHWGIATGIGDALDSRLFTSPKMNRQLLFVLPMFLSTQVQTIRHFLGSSVNSGFRILLIAGESPHTLLKDVYISIMTQVAVLKSNGTVTLWEQYQVTPDLPVHLTKVGHWEPWYVTPRPPKGDPGLRELEEVNVGMRPMVGAGLFLGPREEIASRRGNLDGVTLRCMADDFQPLTIPAYGPKGDYRVSGSFVDIIAILEQSLNFTCRWSRPADRAWGSLQPDGSWNGMIGDLIADKGDVIVAIGRTLVREQVVDFTFPILLDWHIMVMRRPGTGKSGISWSSYTQEFTTEAWVGAGVMLFFMGACITFVSRYSVLAGGQVQYIDALLLVLGAACQQGTTLRIQGTPGRIVLVTVLLLGTVTYCFYTSFLISALSVNILALPFSTLDELTRVGTHQLMVLRSTVQEDVVKTSSNPVYQRAWKNIQEGGEVGRVATNDIAFSQVLNTKSVFLTTQSEYTYQYGADSRMLALKKEKYIALSIGVAVTKKSQLRDIFDHKLIRMKSSGILNKILKDWADVIPPTIPNTASPMSLFKTGSAFLLLMAGTGLALLILVMEILIHKRSFGRAM